MAAIPGSVGITGFIAPKDSADTYATTDPLYGIDGWRSVADSIARDAITTNRRREGMIVITQDTGIAYQLKGGITNSDWVEFSGDMPVFDILREPTGFDKGQSTAVTSIFTDGTRIYSIQPTGTDFDYYINGTKYISTGDTIVISNTEGLHYIYYTDSGLTSIANPTNGQIVTVILEAVVTAIVYWDATNLQQIYFTGKREFHSTQMDGATHANLHFTRGSQFSSGCALNTFSIDGSGALNVHAQFGGDAGNIIDEDLDNTIAAFLSTTGTPVFYKDGAAGNWRSEANAGFSILNTGTGRLAWNELTGGVWQKTEVTNNQYANTHIFAINNDASQFIAVMGQADYSNAPAARLGAADEVNQLILAGLPFVEGNIIGTVIFQTNDSYGNAVKSRVRDTGDADSPNYVDFRFSNISPVGTSVSDHNNLSNVQQAGAGILNGHISNQAQTIAGDKSYTAAPIFNSAGDIVDFTIKENGGGTAYSYTGTSKIHAFKGGMYVTGTGQAIFNFDFQDKDFSIRAESSGNAYNYNAGTKTHTFNGAELSLNDNQGAMNVFIRKLTSGDAFEYNATAGTMAINVTSLVLSPSLAVTNGGTAITSYTLGQSLWGNSSNELTANIPVAGTGMSIAHDATTGQPTFNADGTGGVTATNATYFNKAGDSGNNGLAQETAKDAIADAITVAQALTPAVDKLIAVNCDDAGIYTEYVLTAKPYINVEASAASIVAGTENQSYIGSNNTVRVKSQTMTSSTDTPILVKNGSGDSKYISEYLGDTASTASLLAVSGGGTLNSFIDVMEGANRNISAINVTSGHINQNGIDITGKLDLSASQSANVVLTGDWDGDFIVASATTTRVDITGNWTGDLTATGTANVTITCGSRTLDGDSDSIDDTANARIFVRNIGVDPYFAPARADVITNYNISPAESGTTFTEENTNTIGDILNFNLPPATPNLRYKFLAVRIASRVLKITTDGTDVIYTGQDTTVTLSSIIAANRSAYIELAATGLGRWQIVNQTGSWSGASPSISIIPFTSSRSLDYTDVNGLLYITTDTIATLTIDDTTNANTRNGSVIKIARAQTTVTSTSLQILTGGSAVIISRESNNYIANPSNNKPYVAFATLSQISSTTWLLEGDVSATAN